MADDFIRRADALKHKRRYENPDIVDGGPYIVTAVPCEVIENLPAADVVEVVRCKDCTNKVEKHGKLWCSGSMVLPFHYCSSGKRRTEEKEMENELKWKTYTNEISSAGVSITVNEWKDAD